MVLLGCNSARLLGAARELVRLLGLGAWLAVAAVTLARLL